MNRTEHLLAILAEEAVEVAQRSTKALRFGIDEIQPGQDFTNGERISYELEDLYAVFEMLGDRLPSLSKIGSDRKKEKVEKFLEYSSECGTLQSDSEVILT